MAEGHEELDRSIVARQVERLEGARCRVAVSAGSVAAGVGGGRAVRLLPEVAPMPGSRQPHPDGCATDPALPPLTARASHPSPPQS